MNTVRSAAVFANFLAQRGHDTLHLSTSLCPKDRSEILENIRHRLADTRNTDWSHVATSCVEAGVDLSFRTGLRERAGLVNLLQLAGRVNRNSENEFADVYDFRILQKQGFGDTPSLRFPLLF